jgi:anti-sigma factor RsiW
MKSHDDYSLMIQLFVDDELTEEERKFLLEHVKTCADCLQQLEETKAFSQQVREARPQTEASAALRERVLLLAGKRSHKLPTILWMKSHAALGGAWKPLAAAAILTLVAGAAWSNSYLHQEARAKQFIDSAVVEHRKCDDEAQLDVRSSSPEVVSSWFARRVSFPFRIPNAGIASDDRAKYTLVGGRLVNFGGESAALLLFKISNDRISLLVSSNKQARARGGKVIHSDGLSFHSVDLENLHVATWDNQGLTYALTSSIAMGSSHSCSTCHKDSAMSTTMLRRPRTFSDHFLQMSALRREGDDPFWQSKQPGCCDGVSIPMK